MKVFYSDKMTVADQGEQSYGGIKSPSARKPKEIAEALVKEIAFVGNSIPNIQFVPPNPLTIDDLKLCHDPNYVDGVMNLTLQNGFGTKSKEIADSLLYTNGAMYDAAKAATPSEPTCALVSGFHHAGYLGWANLGWFCTFNGLTITAAKLIAEGAKKVAILDCDMHYGNGTDDILDKIPELKEKVLHNTFGKAFFDKYNANIYLDFLRSDGLVYKLFKEKEPDVILYQAGADVHVDDPYGGILTTEEMYERDLRVFTIAKSLDIPLVWNLAGGYQIEQDGSIGKVIDLHLNTFKACKEVYQC